ncbi:hypothetical protein COU62_02445 [Candidatus Pacearchaeota archaeon CG10_big_fil_rev_8_21_14_0_10_35_219]|nr:hypothetical protein [Candidatus Pacearchaeota archaeon]PIO07826.1 MAG: hypothetical protein COU62_02445 [Candidatus Pacearchaeota archaeon CG10_big_fil_rev_8_21_14_0_10_35_219]PIY81048.1 MAG: hypothetical protein COY79_04555 [Candidatus Pacearchaeota archaeon CG_4_10_14_0_8_um_filter_35_169]PIZ79917.1 MAG: hypothetical protein COY00_02860 [Candidatus Pacearchaeota archaeon CG_4_10_14_0_2_um_filter_35_33]PJA70245.1 MAG: hypothetical protein CO155_01220 [Candidatus Pacearchaeota archaeon CG_4
MKKKEKEIYIGIIVVLILIILIISLVFIGVKRGKRGKDNNGANPPIVEGQREDWQVVPVSGAKCGNGEEYVMGFSAGPAKINGKPNNRLVIWLPGGGDTMVDKDGKFRTNVGFTLGLINPPKQFNEDNSFIFLDHPDNNDFVKDANWVILPYCTQDFHSGRLTEPIEYDFTGETGMVKSYENLINNKINFQEIEKNYPYVRTVTHEEDGRIIIDKLYISIIHDGGINIELGLDKTFELLKERDFDLDRAEIIMAGSSAGSFGTWYNAWRVGDILYKHPGAKFTIIPESGSPITRGWNGEELVVENDKIGGVNYRLSYYDNVIPCKFSGGEYLGGGNCKDILDLIDHYHERWPGMDFTIMPVANKEDLVLVGGLGDQNDPGFDAKLLKLCQTIHRYSQYISKIDEVYPYTLWQYKDIGSKEARVHGLTNSLLTVKMVSPNDQQSDEYGILKMINDVATRKLKWNEQVPHIEYTLNVVRNPKSKVSTVESRPNYLQECNVPWPNQDRPS